VKVIHENSEGALGGGFHAAIDNDNLGGASGLRRFILPAEQPFEHWYDLNAFDAIWEVMKITAHQVQKRTNPLAAVGSSAVERHRQRIFAGKI
jgi:hypothetical protein